MVDDAIFKRLWTNEKDGLRSHRRIYCYIGLCVVHRFLQRCQIRRCRSNINTFCMVKAGHQLHVTIRIGYRHKGLFGNLQRRMVVALWLNIACCGLRSKSYTTWTNGSFPDSVFQLSRSKVYCKELVRLNIFQLYVVGVKTRLVFIFSLCFILCIWFRTTSFCCSPGNSHFFIDFQIGLNIPKVVFVYYTIFITVHCNISIRLLTGIENHVIYITSNRTRSLINGLTKVVVPFIYQISGISAI